MMEKLDAILRKVEGELQVVRNAKESAESRQQQVQGALQLISVQKFELDKEIERGNSRVDTIKELLSQMEKVNERLERVDTELDALDTEELTDLDKDLNSVLQKVRQQSSLLSLETFQTVLCKIEEEYARKIKDILAQRSGSAAT